MVTLMEKKDYIYNFLINKPTKNLLFNWYTHTHTGKNIK